LLFYSLDPFGFGAQKPDMKYLLILSVIFTVLAPYAQAQNDDEKTPREQIVQGLRLADAEKDAEKANEIMVEPTAETVAEIRTTSPEKSSLEILLDILKAEIVIPKKPALKIAPFYLSAQEYLDGRGDATGPQLILHYEVVSGAASGEGLGTVKDVELTLGEKFAAMQIDKNLTIYDFKLNRILTIKPEYNMAGKTTKNLMFENTSLYAKAYRDIAAVRRATNNGRLKKLDMGQGTTLDAYWVESAMSWAAGNSDAELAIEKSETSLEIKRDGAQIFSAEFTHTAYESNDIKNSLFAFAHHEWPLHPAVLRALYAYDAPPKRFEMLSYGPTAPKGQKQVWTLVERIDTKAVFPLPPNAIGAAQAKNVSPLVFLINEAVQNKALGGVQSVQSLAQDFNAKMDMEAYWQAWIVGQKYAAYSGGCQNPDDPTICKALIRIEQTRKADLPKRVQDYMTAVSAADRKGQKGEAVITIKPYLDEKETPAFVVRTAAMARAKMKSDKAKDTGVASINAENLLLIALAKDPYDPNTYVGLAQVLAAKGSFEQSWDVYDALRVGIPTAATLDLKINRLEQKLRKTAPGYFLE